MEQGSLRCDVNVSLNEPGDEWGTRSETKNVNSLRSVERAVRSEVERQAHVLRDGGRIVQETRHFHEDTGRSTSGRSKEEATDYRYFPEPDLIPIAPDPEWVAKLKAELPEAPSVRRARLTAELGLSELDSAGDGQRRRARPGARDRRRRRARGRGPQLVARAARPGRQQQRRRAGRAGRSPRRRSRGSSSSSRPAR